MMKKKFSLKDALFNVETVTYLADLFKEADDSFGGSAFVDEVMERLCELELKERIVWIAQVLEKHLPKDFKKASKLIVKALPPPLDPSKSDNDYGSFIFAPLGEYVVRNGLQKELLSFSYNVLLELTERFSMEDAMRSFLNTFPKETLAQYTEWAQNENYHVRRLVSESTRPFLPWSRRICISIQTPFEFLNVLYSDKTRYVTRSVANHLNDCTKEDPLYVIETLVRWKMEGRQDEKELQWMTKHALRTLVKKGNKDALALLGYTNKPKITVEQFSLSTNKIVQGEALSFEFVIVAIKDASLMIDYSINFIKANGKSKPKVFKIKKINIQNGERASIIKKHRFVKDATTFTLYSGIHTITLHINGTKYNSADFIVTQT